MTPFRDGKDGTIFFARFFARFFLCLILNLAGAAWAMPEYALREHKQCVYCHFDPRGGGPVNAAGRYFALHLSLEGYVDKLKKKRPKKTTTSSPAVPNAGALDNPG